MKTNMEQLDFISLLVMPYIDHPSFGTAIIGRILESEGYTVGNNTLNLIGIA